MPRRKLLKLASSHAPFETSNLKEAPCLYLWGPRTGKELLGRTGGVTECCDLQQMMREVPRKPLIMGERNRLKCCHVGDNPFKTSSSSHQS